MCIIITKPKNKSLPCDAVLEHSFRRNPDGSGFMFARNGKVHIHKGYMTYRKWAKAIKRHIRKDDVAILHCRLATHGLHDGGNTHPFPVTRSIKLLRSEHLQTGKVCLAHNGVISIKTISKLSDTQTYIKERITESVTRKAFHSQPVQNLIESSINGSRLALLKPNGEHLLIGDWIEDGGIYYSNNGFRGAVSGFASRQKGSRSQLPYHYSGGWHNDLYSSYPSQLSHVTDDINDIVEKKQLRRIKPNERYYCDWCAFKVAEYIDESSGIQLCSSCQKYC